jgi:hypothetical protein
LLLLWWTVIAVPDADGVVLPLGVALLIVFTAVALLAE